LIRRHALALVAGLLALGLAACTGEADAGSVATTRAAKYADANALADAIEAALPAAGPAKVATLGVSNSGSKSTATGTVRFGDDFGMDVETGGTLPKVRVLVVGDKVFSRPVQEVKGKPWVRVDNASTQNEIAGLFGPLSETMRTAIDAQGIAEALRFASSYEPIGTQDLAGQSFDAYRLGLDLNALIASLPKTSQADAKKHLFAGSMVYTVYLDNQDRPRQVKLESELNGVPTSQTTDYTQWGVPADYQAPPPNQVTSLTEPTKH
jgi:hypothetical protein